MQDDNMPGDSYIALTFITVILALLLTRWIFSSTMKPFFNKLEKRIIGDPTMRDDMKQDEEAHTFLAGVDPLELHMGEPEKSMYLFPLKSKEGVKAYEDYVVSMKEYLSMNEEQKESEHGQALYTYAQSLHSKANYLVAQEYPPRTQYSKTLGSYIPLEKRFYSTGMPKKGDTYHIFKNNLGESIRMKAPKTSEKN